MSKASPSKSCPMLILLQFEGQILLSYEAKRCMAWFPYWTVFIQKTSPLSSHSCIADDLLRESATFWTPWRCTGMRLMCCEMHHCHSWRVSQNRTGGMCAALFTDTIRGSHTVCYYFDHSATYHNFETLKKMTRSSNVKHFASWSPVSSELKVRALSAPIHLGCIWMSLTKWGTHCQVRQVTTSANKHSWPMWANNNYGAFEH